MRGMWGGDDLDLGLRMLGPVEIQAQVGESTTSAN